MSNYFLAYKGSGEDQAELLEFLHRIKSAYISRGDAIYITDLDKHDVNRSLEAAYDRILSSDALVVIMKEGNKSEGMLVEIGFAYKRVPISIFKHTLAQTRLTSLADQVSEWNSVNELEELIRDGN
ncbi:MAG: hypothetical protein KA604_03045 [Candidatus Saccharimonas sp.]|nr:hypothetical protein [Candidatus Saccharimonas sp.]